VICIISNVIEQVFIRLF